MKLRILLAWAVAIAPVMSLAQNESPQFKLSVRGALMPGACRLQISELGTFLHDKVKVEDLNQDTYTRLDVVDRELRITCDSLTKVALSISDSNPGLVAFKEDIPFFKGRGRSWSPKNQYGLRNEAGRSIGSWALMLVPGFKVDQQETDSIYSSDKGAKWQPSVGNFFHDDGSWETWSLPGRGEPVFGKEFVGTMRIQVALDRRAQVGVSDEVTFTGGAVLTLVYI